MSVLCCSKPAVPLSRDTHVPADPVELRFPDWLSSKGEIETEARLLDLEGKLERLQIVVHEQAFRIEREAKERIRLEEECSAREVRLAKEKDQLRNELRLAQEHLRQNEVAKTNNDKEKTENHAAPLTEQTNRNESSFMTCAKKQLANCKRLFIRHVNPKLIHFDKPFFLAMIVGIATSIIFGVFLWHLITSCVTTKSIQSGALKSQMDYIVAKRVAHIDICLQAMAFYNTFETNADLRALEEDLCMPPERTMDRWSWDMVESLVSREDYKFVEDGLRWCDRATYSTFAECEQVKGAPCVTCKLQSKSNSSGRWNTNVVLKVVYQETVCPQVSHMIGVALSWAQQAETFVTLLFVFCFMGMRLVYQKEPHGKEGLCGALKQEIEDDLENVAAAVGTAEVNKY